MNQALDLVGSVSKRYAKTNNPNYLTNVFVKSKAELRKTMELMQMEIDMLIKKNKELESKF